MADDDHTNTIEPPVQEAPRSSPLPDSIARRSRAQNPQPKFKRQTQIDWMKVDLKGIKTYRTSSNMPVMVLLYPAFKAKDPDTRTGYEWREREASGYPGGLQGPKWLQEMEGRFDVRDSARVWADFDDHLGERTCPPFDVRPYVQWPIILGYDYGWPNPSALLPFAFNGRDMCYQIDEIYGTYTVAEIVKEAQRHWWWDRVRAIFADPAVWARNQVTGGPQNTSIAQIFSDEYHLTLQKGQNFAGSDAAYVNLLDSVLWQPGAARFKIFQTCVNTLKEYRLLAWREESKGDMERQIQQISNKNVHAFDAGKYVMLEHWQGMSLANLAAPEGSVEWWLKDMERTRQSARYILGANS